MDDAIDKTELNRVFAAQRANRLALKSSSAEERSVRLKRLREEIIRRATEVDECLHADLRKPRMGADHFEIAGIVGEIDITVAELERWMASQPVETSGFLAGNTAFIQYEARGVVLLFGPWNFAFALIFSPLIAIVAAGNACIVKPNELQPRTSRIVSEIIRAVFPENEVAVFEGGVALAEALQELAFDHVFFTGSPAVGRRVMAAAARHLTSVTLELGGKCPVILDDTSDLADAATKIVASRFFNAGQLCLSCDYVWVPRQRRDDLVACLQASVQQMFYSDGILQKDRLARIVDHRNFQRVKNLLDQATVDGGRIVCGGQMEEDDLTIHPTIIVDMNWQTPLMVDEIFGPILTVHALGLFLQALSQTDLKSQQRQIVSKAQAANIASTDMLNTLLDFSRLEAGIVTPRPTAFALQPLLDKLENEFGPMADAKGLIYRSPPTDHAVVSDAALLELVLRNFVLNAIRYTDSGGVLIGCRRRGAGLSIEVHDTGIGIPDDQREEIFREFHQVGNPERDRRKGLGLGLAIARRLATSLDHPLSLSSREKRGSVFRILVPRAFEPTFDDDRSPDVPAALGLAGVRVLIVEDDAIVRDAMEQLLYRWDCHCRAIEMPADVAFLPQDEPVPDVLICDYRLRENVTGTDAIAMLRRHWDRQIPAIMITGDTAPERMREALESGIPLLHKPVPPDKLYRELLAVIDDRSAIRCDAKT